MSSDDATSEENSELSSSSFDLTNLDDILEWLEEDKRRAEERERQMSHLERVQRRIRFADIYERVNGVGNRTGERDSGLGSPMRTPGASSTMHTLGASSTRQDFDAERPRPDGSILRSGLRKSGDKRRNSKHIDQMRGLSGEQTSNSPKVTRNLLGPMYTYASSMKPKSKPKFTQDFSRMAKNPVKLSEFSKRDPSPVPQAGATILSTPQRDDPDWLLFRTPEQALHRKTNPRSKLTQESDVKLRPRRRRTLPSKSLAVSESSETSSDSSSLPEPEILRPEDSLSSADSDKTMPIVRRNKSVRFLGIYSSSEDEPNENDVSKAAAEGSNVKGQARSNYHMRTTRNITLRSRRLAKGD